MNNIFISIQEKITTFPSVSEASYYLSKQMEEAIDNKNTNLLIQIIQLLYVPENREISKCMMFYPVFQYLLSNINIAQVSKIYQQFFKNGIYPCERSLVKIIEELQKEQKFDEIDSVLQSVQDHPDKINLSEILQPLLLCNNLALVRKYIITFSPEMYGYMDVWEKLVDHSVQKSIQINDLKKTLNIFAVKYQTQKPKLLQVVYNNLLSKLISYKADPQVIRNIITDMIEYKLEIKESDQNTFLVDQIDKFADFRIVLKLITQLKYCLKPSTFSSILGNLIQNGRKFELFCLIELILQEAVIINNIKKGYSFKFEDLLLSQPQLRYIVVQQSFFHKFLSKMEKKQEVSFEFLDHKSDNQDYMWECISFTSDIQSIDDI